MEAIVEGNTSSLLTRTGESPELRLDDEPDVELTSGGAMASAKEELLSASRSAIGDACTRIWRGSAESGCTLLFGDAGGGGIGAGITSAREIGVVGVAGDAGDIEGLDRTAGRVFETSRIMMLPPASRSSCCSDTTVSETERMSSAVGRSTGCGAGGFVTEMIGRDSDTTTVVSSESPSRGTAFDGTSATTGMGTSAVELAPENARKAWSCKCSAFFKHER